MPLDSNAGGSEGLKAKHDGYVGEMEFEGGERETEVVVYWRASS